MSSWICKAPTRPMPAAEPGRLSRRAALAGLTGSGRGRLFAHCILRRQRTRRFRRLPASCRHRATARVRSRIWMCTSPTKGRRSARPLIVFWHGGRWSFGDKADYRFVGAAIGGARLCRRAGELPALSRGQNAGLHGRCRASSAVGGRACRRVWRGCGPAAPDGPFGRRSLGRSCGARSAVFCRGRRARSDASPV